ncbi:cytosolic carboxypeptidase 1-like isoform X2 [Venturia canescens]|uniref:cytosolic carboxypeptidase 1-like isoform X2 n=1 Tax=Venturia canescens TaxID=32260 RepID=UPI001C9CA92B|nr:cytosolic carboxypeptidase 1-like isoform X2 [Venturia canescens]
MKTSNNRQSNVTRDAEFNKENLSLVPANNSTCSGSLGTEQRRSSTTLLLGFLNTKKLREKIDDDNEQPEEEYVMSPSARNSDDAMNDALLEKLRSCIPKIQESGDTIRNVMAKLHARVTSSDRRTRERTLERLWRKESGAMEIFVTLFEACRDNVTSCSIAAILHECISPRVPKLKSKGAKLRSSPNKGSRNAIMQLINLGGTQVLMKQLANSQHADSIMTEVLIQEILWILGQVAQKDQKFASRIKLLNGMKIFHSLLRQHYNNPRTLLPLLLILKSLAKNTFALQALVRDGIVATMEKTFVSIGYSPHLKLRTLLECFKHFTTSKLSCMKFVKVGMVHLLMRLFERWDRFDGQMRLKICNYALNTLQHLCAIKAGRKAIKANNGLQLLYRFCTNCPEDKAYDCLLSRVCGIINQCLEKKELPVAEMSPARFIIPDVNSVRSNSADSGSDADSQANSINSLETLGSDFESGDDEDAHDRGRSASKRRNDSVDSQFFIINAQRSEEDLVPYNNYFRELGDLRSQLLIVYSAYADKLPEQLNPSEEESRAKTLKLMKPREARSRPASFRDNSRENGAPRTLKIFEPIMSENVDNERLAYCLVASAVRSVIPFAKVAYPDLVGGDALGIIEPLNNKDRKVCRSKLLTCVDRGLHPGSMMHETIFDLDSLTSNPPEMENQETPFNRTWKSGARRLYNWDEKRVGTNVNDSKKLQFESRFESGNLRKAIQIGPREYDLILTPDVNSASSHQWFYFEVSSMESSVPYTFNIVNCEKGNSQFNFGMKPILFSVIEATEGRAGWVRTGGDICYYRNCYRRPSKGRNYLTTSFSVTFPHANDVCYLAYHFPYTYTQLMTHIWRWSRKNEDPRILFRVESLCETLNCNESPILTITSADSKINPIKDRKIIFLTSRVHPGESNASWVMHGTLESLLSSSTYANSLRDDYVFKIVPMLNIEGVVNGCNRYGLTNEDLNRRWSNPNQKLHPVIYHTKGLMEYCSRILQKPPHVFVDYHGHSRRKNVFLFGCSRSGSWSPIDRAKSDQPVQYLMLPRLMQKTSPAFALALCSFKVERHKESTARVAIWRQLGVSRSYTMESSFCGCDQGPLAGHHLNTMHLKEVGQHFCQALSMMKDGGEEQWTLDKIPMADSTYEEDGGCMPEEMSSSCESEDESDFDD